MTEERKNKIERVLNFKQPSLTVIMENVDDPHNIGAVMRSADAVGLLEIYILDTKPLSAYQLGKKSSSSAVKWMNVNKFESVDECFAAVRKKYTTILGTHLSTTSESIYDSKLNESVAIVFGNEKYGISDEALAHCDGNIIIPQVGMIHSLNISVAAAVILYESLRQRQALGMYGKRQFSDEQFENLKQEWYVKKEWFVM